MLDPNLTASFTRLSMAMKVPKKLKLIRENEGESALA